MTPNQESVRIGSILRMMRVSTTNDQGKPLSQQELADLCNGQPGWKSIGHFESGRRSVSINHFCAIALATGHALRIEITNMDTELSSSFDFTPHDE